MLPWWYYFVHMPKAKFAHIYKPFVLAILDGWGVASGKRDDDPTAVARTPFLKELQKNYPRALLRASGVAVGLPPRQDGNSEAGHLNLGAGRIVTQDAVRISQSIADGTFYKNSALLSAVEHVQKRRSALHLIGLLSNFNSGHASPDHLYALLKFAAQQKVKHVWLHLFTDGRDSAKYDAPKFLREVERRLRPGQEIATMVGRFYAMDRKKEWSRTEHTYELLTHGKGIVAESAEAAIRHAYNRGESDEYISPTVITTKKHQPRAVIADHDAVVFFNLRSDRARQLAKPFVQKQFEPLNPGSFKRSNVLKDLRFVALTDFGPDLGNILTAYPSPDLEQTLPVALNGLRQLYVAESEKFAHMTYFFNGGYDAPIAGEDRVMVASPSVASYDHAPAMATLKLKQVIVQALKQKRYDFIAVNFASPDMVGHTGNFQACVKAMETVDSALATIGRAVRSAHGSLMVTADHGNVEELVSHETGEVDTEHSTNPVPCLLYNAEWRGRQFLRRSGMLSDVAPTILKLMGIKKPRLMARRGLL